MKTHIRFEHTQSPEEQAMLCGLVTRLLSLPRMLIWLAFCAGLTLCTALALTEDSASYALPLVLLAAAMTCAIAFLVIYTLLRRPRLLRHISSMTGVPVTAVFYEDRFLIESAPLRLSGGYRFVIAQYWHEDVYILHLRIPPKEGGRGDEMLLIPLTQETFDDVYVLAEALSARNRRLIRIRSKAKKPR